MTSNKPSISIKAVGDICPGDNSLDGHGVGALTKKFGCDYPFKYLNGVLGHSDILIGNLEGVLSVRCRKEVLRFGGLPEMADALLAAGFGVITLANNHAFEHGPEILKETIYFCKNAGLEICGLRSNGPYYCEPVILVKKGISIGILAYNWVGVSNQEGIDAYLATINDGLVNYTWYRDKEKDRKTRRLKQEKNWHVFDDVKRLRHEVDVIVLLPHWGYEWTIYPPYGVILEARAFIDAGVDVIIASHPHVAQGIEMFKEKVIAYSLGNFLFDQQIEQKFTGMAFECVIGKDGIKKYDYFAISCDDKCQPKRATDVEEKNFRQIIEQSTSVILSDIAESELDDELIYKEFEKGYKQRKIRKVKFLFFAMIKNPFILVLILRKVVTLLELILLRLQGKKVRW